jgi:hypothetical protein
MILNYNFDPATILCQKISEVDNDFSLPQWSLTRDILYAALWHIKNPDTKEYCFLEGTSVPEGPDAFYLEK